MNSDPKTPPDPDATVLRPAAAGPDADATVMVPAAKPADPDATVLGVPPASGPDATVLGPSGTVVSHTPVPAARSPRSGSGSGAGPLTVGDQFGRYTIVKLLGIGGMGAVYQAWDKELEVVVALKVIRPEAIQDPEAAEEIERRFKRELLLARQVTHRNVVRIHDLGEINGIKYITMTYVDGKDLQTLLKESGRLSIPTTLRIMRGVASGMMAAHAAGVVHRDLKPANIMIGHDGEALIMDFGIARSTGAPAEISAEPKPLQLPAGVKATGRYTDGTVLGSIVGTIEYMAPEQARGEAVDQRADIYTYGLILYDMLIGARRAERAGSALDQLRARMEGPLPPLKAVAPDVPEVLAAIVTRATEPEALNRYQTTVELAGALDRLDEHGVPRPIKRTFSLPLVAAVVVGLLGLSAATIIYMRPGPVVAAHEPVSVVIADFDNRTSEPAFTRTLEPTLRRALEGAGFITAYDRNGMGRVVGATLPEKLDEGAARELAVKQGLGVVVSGSIAKQGSSYTIAMKATSAVKGDVISDVSGKASSPDQVVAAATTLVASVRKALGDRTKESDQIFAMTSLSASSLEVVRLYAAGQEASSNGNFEDARGSLLKAIELDPKFGIGYLALAGVARNMGQLQDAGKYVNEALSHLDGMTERERFTTRGMFYRLTLDYKQCVQEHKDLIQRFAADVVGHNQLALCASKLRDLATARDEMREVVRILPNRAVFRDNLALYSNYAGDFETGEKEARTVLEQVPAGDAFALLALAFSQMGRDQRGPAADTLATLAKVPGRGPTLSTSGLADLAVQEGRYGDATRIAEQGAAADLAAKSPDRAAAKLIEQAYAYLLRGLRPAAVAAADKALANNASKSITVWFLAARIYVDAGQPGKAQALMAALAAEVQPEPQAYGKLVEAAIAMAGKDPRPAVKLATDANALFDTWIGHFDLGRAYLATNQLPQADSEFDRCLKRRGEALSLFLDEEPTYGYFPMVYYYQGRVREAMNLAGAADSYRAYLAMREKAGEDALLADLHKRLKK